MSILTNEAYDNYKALWGEVDTILTELKQDVAITSQVTTLEGKLMDIDLFLKEIIACFWAKAPISLTDAVVDVGPPGGDGTAKKCPGTSAVAP